MKNETPQEPICPTCGNNAQVWTNQISGEKICHRVGCHRAITQWRTLTSPKTGDSTPQEGSPSDFDAKIDSGERKGGL